MNNATLYRITQWRKRLERKGWLSLRRGAPVQDRVIEYHVLWQGRLFSGRVRLADLDLTKGYWEPGTPAYLLQRMQDVQEGVWRVAKDQTAPCGQVMRKMPE